MNKSGKIFWLLLSILFAVGSITAGTIYDGKRKKNLEIQTVKTTSSIKLEETNNDIEEKGKTSKTEESKTKTKNSEEDSNLTEADSTAVTNAENLISVIIVIIYRYFFSKTN